MANSYKGNAAIIDTVSSNLDIANLMFGVSDTPVNIKAVYLYNPTAADKIVLKDKSGNVIVDILVKTSGQDVSLVFGGQRGVTCIGLKLLSADNTMSSGNAVIYFS